MTAPQVEHETWVPELSFAARLALVRHRMGWNIKEAALACGFRPQSWRGWEIENRLPHDVVSVVDQIAKKTGVDPDWLLRGGPMRGRRPMQHTEPYVALTERTVFGIAERPADNRPASRRPVGRSTGRAIPDRRTAEQRPADKARRPRRLAA